MLRVEICEDLWAPIPPSSRHAVAGATVILNLSASNDLVGKAEYRRELVTQQSGRTLSAYVYANAGVHESTTDLVFGGHLLIAENGVLLAEGERFRRDGDLLVADVDTERLRVERARQTSFSEAVARRPLRLPHACRSRPIPRPRRRRRLARRRAAPVRPRRPRAPSTRAAARSSRSRPRGSPGGSSTPARGGSCSASRAASTRPSPSSSRADVRPPRPSARRRSTR